MSLDDILSVTEKSQLSNYESSMLLEVNGPGLKDLYYALGKIETTHAQPAHLVLLRDDGQFVEAVRTRCEWRPYAVEAEFEFPGGPRLIQRSWMDREFVHSKVSIKGGIEGARLAATGRSYGPAKAFVSPDGFVMVEEMDPAVKPLVVHIASSTLPDRVLLSKDGQHWSEMGFEWNEAPVHYLMVFDHLPHDLTLSAHLEKTWGFLPAEEWERAREREQAVKDEWLRVYREDYPDVECPDPRIKDLIQMCFYVQRSNAMRPGGMLPYPFVSPSKVVYPGWWMWDTAFESMVDAWMRDPELAFGNLLNHTIIQSRSGCIPDAANDFGGDTGDDKWIHPAYYDDFPPPSTGICVTGIAVWDVYQKTGDLDFLKRIYPHLVIYERWLSQEKASGIDPDLIAFENWFDVGWDTSKRFGRNGMVNDPDQRLDWDLPVVPTDGNTFFAMLRDALSNVSGLLGEDALSSDYAEKAARTRSAIDRLMWNEDEGFYFDILPSGRMLSVWTPAGFIPLLADIPDENKYERLRKHLLDPQKFWSTYPLPTLSMDDEHFTVKNWWRGCAWPVINWQVNEGLFNYDPEIGLQLLMKTVDMMTSGGSPKCSEYYDPIDGHAGGAVDQGWGAMPVDLLLRHVFGLNPKPDHLELNPHLPADWNEASVRNIFAAGTSIEVNYGRSDTRLEATVRNTGVRGITVTANGETLSLKPGEEGTMEIC